MKRDKLKQFVSSLKSDAKGFAEYRQKVYGVTENLTSDKALWRYIIRLFRGNVNGFRDLAHYRYIKIGGGYSIDFQSI